VHQYHGRIGAEQWHRSGQTSCYDPAFEAGYPKTPVFDEGCRLAELVLAVWGWASAVPVYKWSLWVLVVGAPLAGLLAAVGWGWSAWGIVGATVAGSLLGLSSSAQQLLADGWVDGWAAGLAAIVLVAWLTRFSDTLAVEAWLICAAANLIIGYCQPLLWLPLGVVVFVHYVVKGPHQGVAWHLGYIGIACVGIMPNASWLVDWCRYWWLRPAQEGELFWSIDWNWGGLIAGKLWWAAGVIAAVLGWRRCWQAGCLTALASVLVGLSAGLASPWTDASGRRCLELLSVAWAVAGLWGSLDCARIAYPQWRWRLNAVLLGFLGLLALAARPTATARLPLGLTPSEQTLVEVLQQQTSTQARILWEELDNEPTSWSALLPLWTQRWYIGGLHAPLEHAYCVLRQGRWFGRPVEQWSDEELAETAHRFNIGWVVARSAATARRWQRYPAAQVIWHQSDTANQILVLALNRPASYILSGQVGQLSATCERIVLEDVQPDPQGAVVLSCHWLAGLRTSPSYVRVERAPDPRGQGAVDFIRLQMPGPVPRLSLTWDNP
jgi:hypothetical protein